MLIPIGVSTVFLENHLISPKDVKEWLEDKTDCKVKVTAETGIQNVYQLPTCDHVSNAQIVSAFDLLVARLRRPKVLNRQKVLAC